MSARVSSSPRTGALAAMVSRSGYQRKSFAHAHIIERGFLVVDFKIIGAQVGAAFELLRVFFLKFDIHFGRQRIGDVHFARFVTRYVVGLRTDGQKHHFIDFHIGRIAVLRFFPARRARLPPIFSSHKRRFPKFAGCVHVRTVFSTAARCTGSVAA